MGQSIGPSAHAGVVLCWREVVASRVLAPSPCLGVGTAPCVHLFIPQLLATPSEIGPPLAVVFRPLPLLVATSPHWMEAAHYSPLHRRASYQPTSSSPEVKPLVSGHPLNRWRIGEGLWEWWEVWLVFVQPPKSFFVVLEVVKVIRGHSGCPDQAGRPPVRRGRVG